MDTSLQLFHAMARAIFSVENPLVPLVRQWVVDHHIIAHGRYTDYHYNNTWDPTGRYTGLGPTKKKYLMCSRKFEPLCCARLELLSPIPA